MSNLYGIVTLLITTNLLSPWNKLRLNNNDFVGSITPLGDLAKTLKVLDLSNNELTGVLMDATNLTSLESFKVEANQLTGNIPHSFTNLTSLGE